MVLVLLSPVLIFISLSLLATQGRPLLYSGERLAKNGKVFTLYKFRTMKVGAERELEGVVCTQVTPITTLGRLLRICRLDELPQFWNIVNGSMKWFGPRPMRRSVYEQNLTDIPNYHKRLYKTPGLFGPTQIYLPHGAPKRIRFLFFCLTYLGPRKWTSRRKLGLIVATSASLVGKSFRQALNAAHRLIYRRTLVDRRQGIRVKPRYQTVLHDQITKIQWPIMEADGHVFLLKDQGFRPLPEKGIIVVSTPGKKNKARKKVFCQCEHFPLHIENIDKVVSVRYTPLSVASRFFLERYVLGKTIL